MSNKNKKTWSFTEAKKWELVCFALVRSQYLTEKGGAAKTLDGEIAVDAICYRTVKELFKTVKFDTISQLYNIGKKGADSGVPAPKDEEFIKDTCEDNNNNEKQ